MCNNAGMLSKRCEDVGVHDLKSTAIVAWRGVVMLAFQVFILKTVS